MRLIRLDGLGHRCRLRRVVEYSRLPVRAVDRRCFAGRLVHQRCDAARADDEQVARVYEKAGGKASDMSAATVAKWQAIARETAWKDYAAKNDGCARILKLVEKTL